MSEQQQTALAVIVGSLPDKMQAYQMISQSAKAGMFGSYDSPEKALAACFSAEALGVHPVSFMQGVHVVSMKGRISLIPKWEFEHAILKSRIPGYKFKVLEETNDKCVLWGTDGSDEHTVTYEWADAERQGLVQRNPETWKSNRKEMLFKQAYHRLAERIGAHVLAGMPSALPLEYEMKMSAATLTAEVEDVVQEVGSAPVPGDSERDWRKEFASLARANGYKGVKGLVQLVNVLRAEEKLPPIQWAQVKDMDQATYSGFYERCAKRGWPKVPAGAPAPAAGEQSRSLSTDLGVESHAEVVGEDEGGEEPPDTEEAPAPDPPKPAAPKSAPKPAAAGPEPAVAAMEALFRAGKRFMSVTGVEAVKESPKGSGKWWLAYRPILADGQARKVSDNGLPCFQRVNEVSLAGQALVDALVTATNALDAEADKLDRTR